MATNGDGFTDDSVKGPVSGKKNPKLQGPFAYEHKIKVPANDPEVSQHVFKLPVDSEHKAKALNLFSVAQPHMRSFHLNWIGFFITFFSAYGAAPLIPTIRQDVGLTGYKANEAGGSSQTALLVQLVSPYCQPNSQLYNSERMSPFLCRCGHYSRYCGGASAYGIYVRQVWTQIL